MAASRSLAAVITTSSNEVMFGSLELSSSKGSAVRHLCLVTKILGGDIKSLFAKRGIFPFPLAKPRTYFEASSMHAVAVFHIPTLQEALQQTCVMTDFGSGNFKHVATNGKVDIWTFGCLIFELITGGALFKYVPCPKYGLDEPNFMLYQMICYAGNLKANPPILDYPSDISIKRLKVVEEVDVLPIAVVQMPPPPSTVFVAYTTTKPDEAVQVVVDGHVVHYKIAKVSCITEREISRLGGRFQKGISKGWI
ncbi:hypothetical protein ARMSODRAFT_980267 [Armillaria solidipes]|uniref:Protein kinase domain-containing protein n=1 Tax=Armillaria solidipes TaxID=1076256 RepID=A0A2H3BGX8_9AGAR|nr:hypothetical protein ARMSODRAFT_980267 [Armillaria solidipes]